MSLVTDLETEFKNLVVEIENKTENFVRDAYADALVFESKVKQAVVILRQRAANAVVDANVEAEMLVIKAKELWAEALAWVEKLETKLFGSDNVKDHNTGQTFSKANEEKAQARKAGK